MDWEKIRTLANEWVKEAGKTIIDSFEDNISVQFKLNRSDLVTNMDKQTEQFFINKIKENFPDHRILGEEGYGDKIDSLEGIVWIIDPIDGTMNFVHMQRHFAISIGIYENGIGKVGLIYDVAQDELYEGIKGSGAYLNGEKLPMLKPVTINDALISMNAYWVVNNENIDKSLLASLLMEIRGGRSFGSAAIEMAYIASGRTDGYITMRLSPWDFAAGKILIEEVGGIMTTIKGNPIHMLQTSSVFVARPGLHEDILKTHLLK